MQNILLDLQSRTPIYEQIVNIIERYVSLGIINKNEVLPSIRELAQDLGINPNTVKKAYSVLENKKVIYSVSTKGYYVCDNTDKVVDSIVTEKLKRIKEEINELEKLGISKKEIIEKIK